MSKNAKMILRNAGAYIAWVIGPGFATGQEILQFFGSYGYWSFAAIAVTLLGFIVLGWFLMEKGWMSRGLTKIDHYTDYCGKTVGRFYALIIPATLVLLIAVLLSASGATFNQYFGVNHYVGAVIMALMLLVVYLVGFEKMVRLISAVSPIVIAFAVFVGLYTALRGLDRLPDVAQYADALAQHRAAPHWLVSSLLYLSLNFLCGSAYYVELGKTSETRSSVLWGAVIGAIALTVTILLMNLAILVNCDGILNVPVPTLFLARQISEPFGVVYSVVLVLGMFASCTTMVWSFCAGFFKDDPRKNRIFAVVTLLFCLVLGLFPFEGLVSVIYPLIGYAGLVFIACVLFKGIRIGKKRP